jgi:response regulator of citrate/malate metabolism
MSAESEVGFVKQAIEIGANGYLVKPFSLAALKKKVEGEAIA